MTISISEYFASNWVFFLWSKKQTSMDSCLDQVNYIPFFQWTILRRYCSIKYCFLIRTSHVPVSRVRCSTWLTQIAYISHCNSFISQMFSLLTFMCFRITIFYLQRTCLVVTIIFLEMNSLEVGERSYRIFDKSSLTFFRQKWSLKRSHPRKKREKGKAISKVWVIQILLNS